MRIAFFVHSLLSDWNHGNAHFLRGVGTELQARGHEVLFFEPRDAWSLQNLLADHGDRSDVLHDDADGDGELPRRHFDARDRVDQHLLRALRVLHRQWNHRDVEVVRRTAGRGCRER